MLRPPQPPNSAIPVRMAKGQTGHFQGAGNRHLELQEFVQAEDQILRSVGEKSPLDQRNKALKNAA